MTVFLSASQKTSSETSCAKLSSPTNDAAPMRFQSCVLNTRRKAQVKSVKTKKMTKFGRRKRYQVPYRRSARKRDERGRAVARRLAAGALTRLFLLRPERVDGLLQLAGRVGERLLYGRLAKHGGLEVRCAGRLAFLEEVVHVLVDARERRLR